MTAKEFVQFIIGSAGFVLEAIRFDAHRQAKAAPKRGKGRPAKGTEANVEKVKANGLKITLGGEAEIVVDRFATFHHYYLTRGYPPFALTVIET